MKKQISLGDLAKDEFKHLRLDPSKEKYGYVKREYIYPPITEGAITKGGSVVLYDTIPPPLVIWRAETRSRLLKFWGFKDGGNVVVGIRRSGVVVSENLELTQNRVWIEGVVMPDVVFEEGDFLEMNIISVASYPVQIAVEAMFERIV